MATLPVVVTSAGLEPQAPADVLAQLLANVAATNPGYTANLPGTLIEDVASTDVAAILLSDAARVDSVNCLTAAGINAFMLLQLGAQAGIVLGEASNTAVYIQFVGTPGFVISVGFVVGDGIYQYVVQDGGIIGANRGDGLGVSSQLFCVATIQGTWAVGSGTVSLIVTSVPSGISLTCNNPQAGIPSEMAETEESFRLRVFQAGLAASTGMPTTLKSRLSSVFGVQSRLISVVQAPNNGGWEIIVGGGDPYQVGDAILNSGVDISLLIGSSMTIAGITNANPGVITTALNHGFVNGQVVQATGVNGMTGINGVPLTVTVLDEKSFSIGINTTSSGTYVSGGVLTPNARNIVTSLNNYPDSYNVIFVNPPQQSVTVTLTWNTSAVNFVSGLAVAQIAAPAIADYINSIAVGQPINLFEMQSVFQVSIAAILDPSLLTRMIFSVAINGIGTSPQSGTGVINGDPESYFLCTSSDITVIQG